MDFAHFAHSAGGGDASSGARLARSRRQLCRGQGAWRRLCSLCALVSLSKVRGRGTRVAEGRQDLLGFLTHRPDDARLPARNRRPFADPELQHDSCWFFKTAKPVVVPADPDQLFGGESQGTELLDPTCNDVAGYYARLVSWYTQGGFIDEFGVRHESGYHYRIPYWEVFNEIEAEHHFTPEQYATCYDAITGALHKVDPEMKFVGLALAFPEHDAEMIEYFLNPANHKPGTQLDMISYHFYAQPMPEETPDAWQYTFFDQADRLLAVVRYIEEIRKRLSPATRTTLDEIGSILPGTNSVKDPHIPPIYYSASGALYAYVYIETARLGIDVVGESQLMGFPSQYPDVTMIDWVTGRPNARFEVLRLLHDNFAVGDKMLHMNSVGRDIAAAAFQSAGDVKKLLVVNKRNRNITLQLPPEFAHGSVTTVDVTASVTRPVARAWNGTTMALPPFAVTVVVAEK